MVKRTTHGIITLVLGVCVIVLFVLHFNAQSAKNVPESASEGKSSSEVCDKLQVAYVNLDSLLVQYNYSKDLQEKFMRKAESNQATINQKGKALETEMVEFRRKVENNAFFDQDRARREQERLLKKQQDFQELNQKLSNEMLFEQNNMNRILRDTIMSQVRAYNLEKGKFHMIFSNSMNDNILYAEDVYDITSQVVKYMNDRYARVTDK